MKKFYKITFILSSIFFILFNIGIVVLFTTPFGHNLRVIAAEVILSSQHRQYAVYTFLPKEELDDILNKISHPDYANSYDKDEVDKLLNAMSDKLSKMKNESKKGNEKLSTSLDEWNKKEKEREIEEQKKSKLVIEVETVEAKFTDHYYKGKLMTVSNPFNVKLVSSKGRQINANFGEQITFISQREHALGAVNAGGFVDPNGRGNGGTPLGIVIEDSKILNAPGGYDRKTYVAGLNNQGILITGRYNANELLKLGVHSAAGFKPQLIVNGKKMITSGNGGWGYGPRTVMAQKRDGSIMFLVIDGRQPHSIGASLKDCQDFLYSRGAINAMTMDGGSSASMVLNNQSITIPSSVGHIPRYIPNAWIVVLQDGQDYVIYNDGEKVE